MKRALRHELNVSHHFLVTHSGIAARLTPEEAQAVRGLPGIKSVERERLYHTTTFRSPEFIGANQIWDGTAVPGGLAQRVKALSLPCSIPASIRLIPPLPTTRLAATARLNRTNC